MRNRIALLLGALLAVGISSAAFGQGFQGGVRGSVKDSGGVVPGVELTLTNEATNIKRTTVTNERGEYSFAALEPGTYALKATLQGYKTSDRPGLRVGTQTFITMDLTLEVGAIEENVTVTGAAPLIETSNASTGTVLDSTQMQTLPSSGRAAFLIATTVPTVVASGDGQFNRQQDQTNASYLSLGGGTRRGNNYTLDGVPITDITNRAVANPSIESLDDVKVQVHTYDAEMGRTGGGVFNTTLRSGSNQFRGSGFFQMRPVWGAANNYFAQKAYETCASTDSSCLSKNAKADTVYYLFGGGFGGPIVKDKTFFWFSTENYHDLSTRNGSLLLPTQAERNGDFSQTLNGTTPVKIYNPITHVQFPNNIINIPLNPVAVAMLQYLPMPQSQIDNGSTNYNATAQINDYFQQEYAGKVEHKFSDKVSLTGFYLYNRTNEPCSNYYWIGLNDPNRFSDPGDYILARRPQILAINNTWIPSDNSVLALRFGWTRFVDNSTLSIPFDAGTLGFSPTFINQLGQTGVNKFPQIFTTNYGVSGQLLGAINPSYRTYKSSGANASYSRFVGTHTYKFGGDYRRIGVNLLNPGCSAGCINFGREFTSSTGANNGSASDGNAIASFLLGFPSGDSQASGPSTMTLTTPLDIYTNYFGGYAQDDWRVNSKFTLNYGLRVEHETGIADTGNNITIGFDRSSTNALSGVVIPGSVDPTGGTGARNPLGGLMYAGVNGNPTTQGNPPRAKWSPRIGGVYSLDTKTVLRGGYGLYWGPYNYPVPSSTSNNGNYGQIGFTYNTSSPQSTVTPTVSLTNPFSGGLVAPAGSSNGLTSGSGTNISFVDQTRTAPRVQQYSVDLQRDLGNSMAITISYVGARGDNLPMGGTQDMPVNVNQLDPKYMTLGSTVLNQQVANPFFGVAAAGPFSTQATLSRAQLLRPYPQYANVLMLQSTEGVNRYNAAILEWNKRLSHGWAARVSYTYSHLMDNQIGETNFFSNRGIGAPMNAFNYDGTQPACPAGMDRVTEYANKCYDPLVDYSTGLLDTPHRIVASPMFELPFGKGHSHGTSDIGNMLAGGWTVSSVILYQSGFPFGVNQNVGVNLLGNGQRPNMTGTDLSVSGGLSDLLASQDHPSVTWYNTAGFSAAPNGTWGNAPRTIDSVRTPPIINVDIAAQKNIGFGNGKQGQFKIEVFNLFNRPQLAGFASTNYSSSQFGTINSQSGFMRMTQLSFRFMF